MEGSKKPRSREEVAKDYYEKGHGEGMAWAIGQPLASLKEYAVGLTYPYKDLVAFPEIAGAKKKYLQDYEFHSRSWHHGWFDGVKEVISSRGRELIENEKD